MVFTKVEGFMLPCPTPLQQVNVPLHEALLDCSLSPSSPAVQDRLYWNPDSTSYGYDSWISRLTSEPRFLTCKRRIITS